MNYVRAMILGVVALVLATGYDAWVIFSGNLHASSYLPGIYPAVCIVLVVGIREMKNRGLWDERGSQNF